MTTTPRIEAGNGPRREASAYQVQIAGHLDDHWSSWLGGHELTHNGDSTTTLTLGAADQAQLHGVLARIRDLGAPLLALNQVSDSNGRHNHDSKPTLTWDATASMLERTLDTERLTLRPATVEDADATWEYRRLDSVNEWLTGAEAAIEGYRAGFGKPARLATTVIVELRHQPGGKTRSRVIGDFMLRREDAWAQAEVHEQARGAQAELGWVLDPAHSGVGYASEAARELLRYCFEDLGVHRVVANGFLGNEASWRLMERLGMRRESHAVRESLHRTGCWLDTVAYAMLAEEWLTTLTCAHEGSR
jgi:RimJ/RimL family protein N-acetyltransferase